LWSALAHERIEVAVLVAVAVRGAEREDFFALAAGEQRERRRDGIGRALDVARTGDEQGRERIAARTLVVEHAACAARESGRVERAREILEQADRDALEAGREHVAQHVALDVAAIEVHALGRKHRADAGDQGVGLGQRTERHERQQARERLDLVEPLISVLARAIVERGAHREHRRERRVGVLDAVRQTQDAAHAVADVRQLFMSAAREHRFDERRQVALHERVEAGLFLGRLALTRAPQLSDVAVVAEAREVRREGLSRHEERAAVAG
jgi:hypothetical protein